MLRYKDPPWNRASVSSRSLFVSSSGKRKRKPRHGLREDQTVTVRNETGEMRGIIVRAFDIRAGNAAMYFPEANVLVSRTADPKSKTPAFKGTVVSVESKKRKNVC